MVYLNSSVWLTVFRDFNEDPNIEDLLKEKYGLKIIQTDTLISDEYEVIDKKKYLLFLIKYGEFL